MASPYDKIIELIKQLDINDDGIEMNRKVKSIEQDFTDIILDEQMLNDSMEYINDVVLKDSEEAAQKFALLFTTRNFDFFTINETTVRYKMISLLQRNFLNADEYKKINKNVFYNSIILLGEYYHRIRQSDGNTIQDLGSALLETLTNEINCKNSNQPKYVDIQLAKIILSQITLNGKLFQISHKDELDMLLFYMRQTLIEVSDLKPCVKALFLMTFDLLNNNFNHLGTKLEEMYTKYFIDAKSSDNTEILLPPDTTEVVQLNSTNLDNKYEIEDESHLRDTKKWSEQVYEEEELDLNIPFYEKKICDNTTSSNKLKSNVNSSSIYNTNSNYDYINYSDRVYDNDQQSIRSEGGSLKLYNVKDRLRNSNRSPRDNWNNETYDQMSRNRMNNRNQRNQSANNYNNRHDYIRFTNKKNLNMNRPQYDRPPRFNKNNNQHQHQQSQPQSQSQSQPQPQQQDNNNYRNQFQQHNNYRNQFQQHNNNYRNSGRSNYRNFNNNKNNNVPMGVFGIPYVAADDRNSSQNKMNSRYPGNNYRKEYNYERPYTPDSNMNCNNYLRRGKYDVIFHYPTDMPNPNNYRRQSIGNASASGYGNRNQNWRGGRYGSQNSVAASETGSGTGTGTWDKRGHNRNHPKSDRKNLSQVDLHDGNDDKDEN